MRHADVEATLGGRFVLQSPDLYKRLAKRTTVTETELKLIRMALMNGTAIIGNAL